MNFHSDEWIKENLERHYQEALTLFPKEQILGVFLQGSQNYGLDYEDSDIDTKAVIIPTLAEIASAQKPISTTHVLPNTEHIDLKDIRLMIGEFKKQNLNFLEILWTPYFIINPLYAQEWGRLVCAREQIANYCPGRVVKSMKGIALEKFHALEHRYPSRVEWLDKFGYDPKQLHHLIRIKVFIDEYLKGWNFESCFYPSAEVSKYLVRVKTGEEFNLEQARKEAAAAKEHIEKAADEFCTDETFKCDEQIEKLFKSVQEEIIKIALKNELTVSMDVDTFYKEAVALKDIKEIQSDLASCKSTLEKIEKYFCENMAYGNLTPDYVSKYFDKKVCFSQSFAPVTQAYKDFQQEANNG